MCLLLLLIYTLHCVDAKPAEELYVVFNDEETGSLIQTTAQPEENFQTPTPITIDKRKRIIYYVDNNDIKKIGLNSKGTPKTVIKGIAT